MTQANFILKSWSGCKKQVAIPITKSHPQQYMPSGQEYVDVNKTYNLGWSTACHSGQGLLS